MEVDFIQTLLEMRNGGTATDCAQKLADVIQGVCETGKAGEMTLKIKVSAASFSRNGDVTEVELTHEAKAKVPEDSPGKTLFFATGNILSRVDPNQLAFNMDAEEERTEDRG